MKRYVNIPEIISCLERCRHIRPVAGQPAVADLILMSEILILVPECNNIHPRSNSMVELLIIITDCAMSGAVSKASCGVFVIAGLTRNLLKDNARFSGDPARGAG
jgi:hypothetical protein